MSHVFYFAETLDNIICLRSNGFFPHDVRCDHFYECRNSTIINEGICKAGLRFDYRYRKKPRCISSDMIDCRITQIDSPSTVLYELTTGTTAARTTERWTVPTSTTSTTTTTTTTTTPAPIFVTDAATTTPLDAITEAPTIWPQHMNSRPRTRSNRNRAKSLQKLSEDEGFITSTSDEDMDDNTLTKKRKLLRKPLKLRRGHLQEPSSPYIAAGHNHLSTSEEDHSHNSLVSRELILFFYFHLTLQVLHLIPFNEPLNVCFRLYIP